MMRLATAAIALVLMTPATGLGQTAAEQTTDAEMEAMLDAFSRRAESDLLSITVIHLNDITTDVLFTAPAKYSLRAQARGATMFYVQGTIKQDGISVDMDWRVLMAATRSARLQAVNISNFEPGLELNAGDQFSGILALSELVNLYERFVVTNANWRFEYEFTPAVIRQLEGVN